VVREERYQPLVCDALVEAFQLDPDCLYREVKTRDGSIVDLCYVAQRKVVAYELKIADPGEVMRSLDARAIRQLRHFAAACNSVYLVTLAAPRPYNLLTDGRVHVAEPLERQLLPPGVGWMAFDRLTLDCTMLAPAADHDPVPVDRQYLIDHLSSRLGRAQRSLTECRPA
jgi:hypothetical protein